MPFSRKGFTLIELLIVLAVVGLLSVVAVIALGNARASARDAVRLADFRDLQASLEIYYLDHLSYPIVTEPQVLGAAAMSCMNTDGFTEPGCPSPYLAVVPHDPGNNTYRYVSEDGVTYTMYAALEGNVNGLTGNVLIGPSLITNAP